MVSRQFGLNQILPKPLFANKSAIILYNMVHTKGQCMEEMERYFGITQFTLVPINPLFFCTQEYDT